MPTTIIDELGNTVVEVLMPAVAGATGATGPTGATGATGSGGEPGGLTGQVLTKASTDDYDYVWEYKYSGRFNLEAATNRALADATGVTVERYFTCTAEGNGESFNIQSNTPSAGNKIVRKIWYKNEAFEATDVNTWTLLHTFADNTAYASTETQWDAYLEGQTYGKPPFTLALSWEDVPLFTGLLDTYPGAAAAYSVRLLDKDYAGNCIRVRRASDNTEQDIGFDGNGDLDTGALTSFCTGTNCFVKTWYDQSGNARDATQATTASQPKIYDSSTGLITKNSIAAADFNGSQFLITGSFATSSAGDWLCSSVASGTAGATNKVAFGSDATTRIAQLIRFASTNVSQTIGFNTSGTAVTDSGASYVSNQQHLMTSRLNSGTLEVYLDGVSSGSSSHTNQRTDSGQHAIGARGNNGDIHFGTIQEIVLYPSDQSANRTGIETNINDYFNIY